MKLAIAMSVLLGATLAHAQPAPTPDDLVAAIAHHHDADVAALRARLAASIAADAKGAAALGDPAIRCTLGAVYLARGDLARASIDLLGCEDAALTDPLREPIARALHDLPPKLRASELSSLAIDARPPAMVVELDAMPGERLLAPATIWVPAGDYKVSGKTERGQISNTVKTEAHSRSLVLLDAGAPTPSSPKTGAVDFGDDEAADVHSGAPADLKHGSILPDRYQKKVAASGPQLEDPFAPGHRVNPLADQPGGRPRRSWWLGVRAGGLFSHDGDAGSRFGFDVAIVGSHRTRPFYDFWLGWLVVDARVDYSRRSGGALSDPLDAFALSVGPRWPTLFLPSFDLDLGFALRGELRSTAELDGAAVHRVGLGLDPFAELRIRDTPLVLGLRARLGVTPLAPGTHDFGALVELGLEL